MKLKQIIIGGILVTMATLSVSIATTTQYAYAAPKTEKECKAEGGKWENSAPPHAVPKMYCLIKKPSDSDLGTVSHKGDSECGGVATSIIGGKMCEGGSGRGGTIVTILTWVIRLLSIGVGIAAVGGFIYGAILYTSAGDKPDQVKKAHALFLNITIGLVAYGLMVALLNFLIPGGVFT